MKNKNNGCNIYIYKYLQKYMMKYMMTYMMNLNNY